ncbi:hypothetical protein ACFL96_17825, partial [Thermoproteota archaeon]
MKMKKTMIVLMIIVALLMLGGVVSAVDRVSVGNDLWLDPDTRRIYTASSGGIMRGTLNSGVYTGDSITTSDVTWVGGSAAPFGFNDQSSFDVPSDIALVPASPQSSGKSFDDWLANDAAYADSVPKSRVEGVVFHDQNGRAYLEGEGKNDGQVYAYVGDGQGGGNWKQVPSDNVAEISQSFTDESAQGKWNS